MAVYASSEFSRVFSALDRDGDGKLSAAELRLCMKAALGEDVSAEEADADGDGLLSQEELLALALAGTAAAEEEEGGELRAAAGAQGGVRDVRHRKRRVHHAGEPEADARQCSHQDIDECRAMICRFDLDGDGVLSFEEFKIMMDS